MVIWIVIVNRVCAVLVISERIKFTSFENTIESYRYANWKLATFYSVLSLWPFLILEVLLFITTRYACWTTLNEMLELMFNIFMAKLLFEVYQIIFHNFMIFHGEWNCCDSKRKIVACYCNLDELENGKSNFQRFWIMLHRHKNIS